MAVVVDDVAALADISPGPRLAAVLARIDPARVPNNDLLSLLAAQSRQANHEAARLLGVIAEVGRAAPTFDDGAVDRFDRSCTTFLGCTRRFSQATSTGSRCGSSPTICPGSPRRRSRRCARSCYRWPTGSLPDS